MESRPASQALVLSLTVQFAEVLKMISVMPGFHGRGLLARVLYSLPVNTVGHRKVRTDLIPPAVGDTYSTNLHWLARFYAEWTDPAPIQMGPGAAEMLLQEAEAIEPQLGPGAGLGHMADWGSKLIGATARIAGLLHAAEHIQEDGWRQPVGEDTMAKAIAAGRYFTQHALAVFDYMGADPALDDARVVLDWIRRNGQPRFAKRDLHRGMQTRFRKAADVDPALEMLTGHGWIRVVEPPASSPGRMGRPKSTTYDVHPQLFPGG